MAAWGSPRDRKPGERNWPWVLMLVVELMLMLLILHYRV